MGSDASGVVVAHRLENAGGSALLADHFVKPPHGPRRRRCLSGIEIQAGRDVLDNDQRAMHVNVIRHLRVNELVVHGRRRVVLLRPEPRVGPPSRAMLPGRFLYLVKPAAPLFRARAAVAGQGPVRAGLW